MSARPPLRVCLVVEDQDPERNGGQVVTQRLLAAAGWSVDVVPYPAKGRGNITRAPGAAQERARRAKGKGKGRNTHYDRQADPGGLEQIARRIQVAGGRYAGVTHIIVLLDGDRPEPYPTGQAEEAALAERAAAVDSKAPVLVAYSRLKFESWLLTGVEDLVDRGHVEPATTPPTWPTDARPEPKRWLAQHCTKGYRERRRADRDEADARQLAEAIDWPRAASHQPPRNQSLQGFSRRLQAL